MVIAPEGPKRRPESNFDHWKGLTEEFSHKEGYMWTQDLDLSFPGLTVWRNTDDTICIRQENKLIGKKEPVVDVLRFTDVQAYGLLKAISRAMETNYAK